MCTKAHKETRMLISSAFVLRVLYIIRGGGTMHYLIIALSLVLAGELEVEGDLKLQGDLIFQDESAMTTAAEKLPAGIIFPFAGQSAPDGYLICAGQEVSRVEYAELFEVIGELYGSGDGETTFNLPDLRGRMPLGKDNMNEQAANRVGNMQADSLGGAAGEENHQLTVDEMPSHTHLSAGDGTSGSYTSRGHGNYTNPYGGETGASGENQPHNNMPPYLTLNYLIKY